MSCVLHTHNYKPTFALPYVVVYRYLTYVYDVKFAYLLI